MYIHVYYVPHYTLWFDQNYSGVVTKAKNRYVLQLSCVTTLRDADARVRHKSKAKCTSEFWLVHNAQPTAVRVHVAHPTA